MDVVLPSSGRSAVVLLLALAVHSIFETMALGLADTPIQVPTEAPTYMRLGFSPCCTHCQPWVHKLFLPNLTNSPNEALV